MMNDNAGLEREYTYAYALIETATCLNREGKADTRQSAFLCSAFRSRNLGRALSLVGFFDAERKPTATTNRVATTHGLDDEHV